jgi:hypothetical protein
MYSDYTTPKRTRLFGTVSERLNMVSICMESLSSQFLRLNTNLVCESTRSVEIAKPFKYFLQSTYKILFHLGPCNAFSYYLAIITL